MRPILEYNIHIWNPQLLKDIDAVESVQRYFTRRLLGQSDLSYTDRILKFNLQSLENRRINYDLLFCYKIIHNLVEINYDDYFKFNNSTTRGHSYKLRKFHHRTEAAKFFFPNRIIDNWNSLSPEIVNLPTAAAFKRALLKLDFITKGHALVN